MYGEGRESAFNRLQASVQISKEEQECVQYLRITDTRDDKKRIEETQGGLLEDSYCPILENSDSNNGVVTTRAVCYGSRAIPARARPCCSAALSMT